MFYIQANNQQNNCNYRKLTDKQISVNNDLNIEYTFSF